MDIKRTTRLDLGKLVNFGSHKDEPVHRWFCYRHSFSTALVNELISYFGISDRNSKIFDPFCGSGTTLLACQELGLECEGVDKLPFAVFVSNAKTGRYNKRELARAFDKLTFQFPAPDYSHYTSIPIVKKAFSPEVLSRVLALRDEIEQLDAPRKAKTFLKLCWFSILEPASNTVKDGAFLRILEREVGPEDIARLFSEKFVLMLQDVVEGPRSAVKAFEGDSRGLPSGLRLAPYDAIITSPPYPNRHDYTRIYALELILGNAVGNNSALKALRYQTLRSHVEARLTFPPNGYVPPEELVSLLNSIAKSASYDGRNIAMLQGYFEDMYLVLKQLYSRCSPGARVAMVVSDVRFSGVTIPVGDLLCTLSRDVGYKEQESWILRQRGNTPQQLRSFPKERTTESVVMFTRP